MEDDSLVFNYILIFNFTTNKTFGTVPIQEQEHYFYIKVEIRYL